MPWESERHCYSLNPEWEIWDLSDKLISSFSHHNVLVFPLERFKLSEGRIQVATFLESDPLNHVVLFNFIDACDYFNITDDVYIPDTGKSVNIDLARIHILENTIVNFSEYWLSHQITNLGVTEPNYVNDFLCYQRKTNHHRPEVYDALKDRNGIVTLGTVEFEFNSAMECRGMSDIAYERDTGHSGAKVKTDMATLGNIDVWNDSFLIITSETMPYPKGDGDFISEKTFKPMMGKRPFITLGANHLYYEDLRSKGYYTFENDFPKWKRGPVEDHAVELADFLSAMDQRSYYMDNKQKFDHNYENLRSSIDRNIKNFKEYLLQFIP